MSGEHAHDEYAEVAPVEAALVTIDQTVAYLSERVSRLTAQVVSLEAGAAQMGVTYIPPDKKTSALALDCDGVEHALDVGNYTPGRTALTLAGTYFNVDSFTLKDPAKPGRLRIWMRRAAWNGEPVDNTFYYDIWLERPGYGTLDTRTMFEKAEGGRPLSWRYKVTGASAVTLSTRFVKYAQVS